MSNYDLVDGEKMNRRSPTFDIPSASSRYELPSQCHVKLGFIVPACDRTSTKANVHTEKMWVKVEDKEEGKDLYYGTLESIPTVISKLTVGDPIQFSAKHILDIIDH
jgi:hypothetical protein